MRYIISQFFSRNGECVFPILPFKGSSPGRLKVCFPISCNDGFGTYPKNVDMVMYVDDFTGPTSKISLEGESEAWIDPIKWNVFETVFPSNGIEKIGIDCFLEQSNHYLFVAYCTLYVTGLGLTGTMRSEEIIFQLKYWESTVNIPHNDQFGWRPTTVDAELSNTKTLWYYENNEPGVEHKYIYHLLWLIQIPTLTNYQTYAWITSALKLAQHCRNHPIRQFWNPDSSLKRRLQKKNLMKGSLRFAGPRFSPNLLLN